MDLRDKLKHFEGSVVPRHEKQPQPKRPGIETVLKGEIVQNEKGSFFCATTDYFPEHCHGDVPLSGYRDVDSQVFGLVGKDPTLAGIDLSNALFIDTETTGLAGGTGTVPFLVGLGYFTKTGFRIEQLFMRDYVDEGAVLYALAERLSQATALVSYNGKAYDMNLLNSRFILARMQDAIVQIPHLDLLFTARRIWRSRLSDCSLSSIETHVLGFQRQDDVPGFMIPGLYFEYLRTRDGTRMEPVFRHNRWDILALAALVGYTARVYENPRAILTHPQDMIGLGRAFDNSHCADRAVQVYREALNFSLSPQDRSDVLRFLGDCYKRMADWSNAVEVWEQMKNASSYKLYAFEELAKFYEHRKRDLDMASETVQAALVWLDTMSQLHPHLSYNSDRQDLNYRMNRLRRKMARKGDKKGKGWNTDLTDGAD